MKLRSEVGVGSGVGSGLRRVQEIQCRFRENTPPSDPEADLRGQLTLCHPEATRPDPPSRRLRVDVSHWSVRH